MLCNLLILCTGFHYSLWFEESIDHKLWTQEILSRYQKLAVSDSSDLRLVSSRHSINQPFKDIIKITLLYQYCIVRKLYGKDKFKCLMPLDEDTDRSICRRRMGTPSTINPVCIHIHSATTYQPFKVLCQIFYI